jgi:hypothetical protein
MISVTIHFTDHHIGSASQLARIAIHDWPATTVIFQYADHDKVKIDADHAKSCTACQAELLLNVE